MRFFVCRFSQKLGLYLVLSSIITRLIISSIISDCIRQVGRYGKLTLRRVSTYISKAISLCRTIVKKFACGCLGFHSSIQSYIMLIVNLVLKKMFLLWFYQKYNFQSKIRGHKWILRVIFPFQKCILLLTLLIPLKVMTLNICQKWATLRGWRLP